MPTTAATRSSLDALDQWGIEFPLAPQDLAGLIAPTESSVSRVVSSRRLSILTLPPRRGDSLDQWGIEFPIAYDELAAFGAKCRGGRGQAWTSATLVGRLHGLPRFAACAAVLAVVVAGSASVVPSTVSADDLSTRNETRVIVVADSVETPPLAWASEQPPATPNPTPGPTPGAELLADALAADALAADTVSNTPAAASHPFQANSMVLPTIQDARNYLVSRLGTRVDRHFGMSQSRCASLIFQYEASWDPHATNKSSGAYGLPQANPARKLADWAAARAAAAEKAGHPEVAWLYRAWRDNPVVQAEWGVDYMIGRYGSPCAALTFRSGAGWY
jgi:hypothetical protein